jgi:hypothetical protein
LFFTANFADPLRNGTRSLLLLLLFVIGVALNDLPEKTNILMTIKQNNTEFEKKKNFTFNVV